MHRRFAAWLVGQPWRAFFVAGAFAAMSPQGFSPFAIVAAAVAVLMTLQGSSTAGASRGAAVALATFGIAVGLLISIQQPPSVIAGLAGIAFLGPWLLAELLRRTGSLNLCFQVAILALGAVLVGVHVGLDDPTAQWQALLTRAMEELATSGLRIENSQQLVLQLARTMWGAYAALALLTLLSSLFLGRWWQSLLEAPGAFGAEYRELRLGVVLGTLSIVIVVAAAFTDRPMVDCLAWLAVSGLAYQGLAAAHRRKSAGRLNRNGLAVIYVFLLVPLSAFIMVTLLAAWGAADNWRRLKV